MRSFASPCLAATFLAVSFIAVPGAHAATLFAQVSGHVQDPQHHPVRGAVVVLQAADSALIFRTTTNADGMFDVPSVPLGEYTATISQAGFRSVQEQFHLTSQTVATLQFALTPGQVTQSAEVHEQAEHADTATPTTLISRAEIAGTPGADRTNSMAMITDYVPGAYMTHDMLHMRGGHQVSWLIDGVNIPNTDIASNVGAQMDPKDVEYIEVQRGSYTAGIGDRTYGAFNVVPRSGFERNGEAELVLQAGSFLQTNDQVNYGDHTGRAAYYLSLNGNRSDYGLSTPVSQVLHDAANGYGGFVSLLFDQTPRDQLRFVGQARSDFFEIPYDPDPDSFGNQQFDSSGLRDTQRETDALAAFTWVHTSSPATVLQVSPFFHFNRAAYDSSPTDTPVATTSGRASTYGGLQASIDKVVAKHTLQAGFYSFGEHETYTFGAIFNDGSGALPFRTPAQTNGGVVEEYLSDSYRPAPWLTLSAGLRQTHFEADVTEDATAPRIGAAIEIPKLHWVLRGFYGRFYQPPPLLTATGPLLQYAQSNNTTFEPLHGEHDEEHQFGVKIPLRGWSLDIDTFKTRVNNFLDHSNLGGSSIYFPVTIDGALVRAWELSLRSPQLWKAAHVHLAYSNQIAEQRGAITGGLVCAPITSPECDVEPGYTPVDHDQRNTLNVGFETALPWSTTVSTNVYYGSGFTNGDPDPATPYPDAYLPQHTTFDLRLGKALGEQASLSVSALNVANRRVLLDNSVTFGGFHYNDPREIFAELRYRFHSR
ncbi:TonB-dependent receptor [Acidipila sp. EB88]|uniref:TonB-dependent receptor n=1 Tax=Acidipila sp. EB88 TaxID=2305226 RepID=UPI000F5DE282|nr:TonB-dependent receptor [Acidipila sp. EB88]RRA48700.1 TonB-dependent receptor [Acidipila sp. EB88]